MIDEMRFHPKIEIMMETASFQVGVSRESIMLVDVRMVKSTFLRFHCPQKKKVCNYGLITSSNLI